MFVGALIPKSVICIYFIVYNNINDISFICMVIVIKLILQVMDII